MYYSSWMKSLFSNSGCIERENYQEKLCVNIFDSHVIDQCRKVSLLVSVPSDDGDCDFNRLMTTSIFLIILYHRNCQNRYKKKLHWIPVKKNLHWIISSAYSFLPSKDYWRMRSISVELTFFCKSKNSGNKLQDPCQGMGKSKCLVYQTLSAH